MGRARLARRDYIEPKGSGTSAEPVVVAENGGDVEPQCRFQVQRVEGAQIRHGQEARTAIDGTVEGSQCDAVEEAGHVALFEVLPHGEAAKLGLEQITGDEGDGCLIEPVHERRALWLVDEQGTERGSIDIDERI